MDMPAAERANEGVLRRVPYWLVVVMCYLVSAAGAGYLWLEDYREIERDARVLARDQGMVVFSLVQLSRQWNAGHGGVWVRQTEQNPPNPYLAHPQRDLVTKDGMRLTMVNPAYMTRQMAEIAGADGSTFRVRFHITSLKPIRPGNLADPWEAETLRMFEQGTMDRLDFFATGTVVQGNTFSVPVYRYMAPLIVNKACLACHASQGYKIGDVRGGISVTMEANDLRAMVGSHRQSKAVSYVAIGVLVALLMHGLVWRAYRYAAHMRRIQREQEQLLSERTQALSDSEARYRSVFDTVTEAIMVLDDTGTISAVNPAFTHITGYTAAEAVGNSDSFLRSGHHEHEFFAEMDAALVAEGQWQGDVWMRRKDGGLLVAWQSVTRLPGMATELLPLAAEAGSVVTGGVVVTFFDITARKTEEDAVRHRAQHDLLTELPNRGLFLDRLDKALEQAQRHGRTLAVMYFDLDKFKQANDSLGHAAGDAILQQTAQRALRCVRAADTVARFGGDEFAILLPEVGGESEVVEIARRLVAILGDPFYLSEGQADISASVGIALFPVHGTSAEALQQCADKAMYAVKRGGRNGFRVYSDGCAGVP